MRLIVLVGAIFAMFSCGIAVVKIQRRWRQPRISSATVDFGTVVRGDVATRKVRILNKGNTPLIVGKATVSCGCTVAETIERTILPHSSAPMTIRMDSGALPGGKREIDLTVPVNFPGQRPTVLRAKVVVNVEVHVLPEPLSINFGTVPVSRRSEQPLTLSLFIPTAHPKGVKITSPDVSLSPLMFEEDKGAFVSTVTFAPRKARGFQQGSIVISFEEENNPPVKVPWHAVSTGPLSIVPPLGINHGMIRSGQTAPQSCRVVGSAPRLRPTIASSPKWTRVRITKESSTWIVHTEFVPKQWEGKRLFQGEIVISTDIPAQPELRIPVVAVTS